MFFTTSNLSYTIDFTFNNKSFFITVTYILQILKNAYNISANEPKGKGRVRTLTFLLDVNQQ